MRLKIYRAPSMVEALRHMRTELGADALILSARTLREGVEITAGLDPDDDAEDEIPPPRPLQAVASHHGVPEVLARRFSTGSLEENLGRLLAFAPIDATSSPILFVGPPGAGKTSTVARLATRLVLDGTRPMVITADGRRAGATEQLAAYTRLLGLNLVVATHPLTLGRALSRREAGAPVLIDAPGSDHNDKMELQELATLAVVAGARIALVLPAGLDIHEATDIAAAYAGIGAGLLVATRLDLVRRLGSTLGAAASAGLAFTEGGIGPGAADGLVALTPRLLAERLQRDLPAAARQPTKHEAIA